MSEPTEPIAPYRPIPDDDDFIDIIQNGSMYAEVTAFQRLAATIGVEQAYRQWARLQHQATTHELQEEVDRLIDELAKADKRAEQAEVALADLRERLGKPTMQRGLRYGKLDPLPIPDDQVEFYLDQGHVGLVERDVWHSKWRKVDTTPTACCECGSFDVAYRNYRMQLFCAPCADGNGPAGQVTQARDEPPTALERAAEEQGVQPVRNVDQLTAPEGERLSDEEWAAYSAALNIDPVTGESTCSCPHCKPGDEQGSARDQLERMLTDEGRRKVEEFMAEVAGESDDIDIDEVIAQNHRDAMRGWGLIDEPGDAG